MTHAKGLFVYVMLCLNHSEDFTTTKIVASPSIAVLCLCPIFSANEWYKYDIRV